MRDCPGSPVVKTPSSNAGVSGLITLRNLTLHTLFGVAKKKKKKHEWKKTPAFQQLRVSQMRGNPDEGHRSAGEDVWGGGAFLQQRERKERRAPRQKVDLFWGHSPPWVPGCLLFCLHPLSPRLCTTGGGPRKEGASRDGVGWVPPEFVLLF